ncbi:hypothetical protein BH11MYX2_BH11MYX2_32730 [soil metagenome]
MAPCNRNACRSVSTLPRRRSPTTRLVPRDPAVTSSSRRPYGLSLTRSTNDTAKPQLWFAAVAVDANGAAPTADPSFAPIWLPHQDPNLAGPRGNHTPAWTSKVVTIQ